MKGKEKREDLDFFSLGQNDAEEETNLGFLCFAKICVHSRISKVYRIVWMLKVV